MTNPETPDAGTERPRTVTREDQQVRQELRAAAAFMRSAAVELEDVRGPSVFDNSLRASADTLDAIASVAAASAGADRSGDTERVNKLSVLILSDDVVLEQDGGGVRVKLCQVNEVVALRRDEFESDLRAAIDALPTAGQTPRAEG